MTITLTGLLLLLLIAGICGALGRALGGGTGGGFLVSIAVGFVGALIGMFLAGALRLPEILAVTVDGRPFPIVYNVADMMEGWDRLRELADSADHIIPGHDPRVLERYPAPSRDLEGVVARLD